MLLCRYVSTLAALPAVSVWARLIVFVLPFDCRVDVDSGVAAIIQYADDRVGKLDRHGEADRHG